MRHVVPTLASALTASLLLTGCPDRSLSEVNVVPDNVEKKTIPVKLNRNIDILFVIDNSGSMMEEQVSLAANFPQFINVLQTIEGGLPDVHIGIVSTNVGTNGVNIGGCSSATRPNGDDGGLLTNGVAGLQAAYLSDIKLPDGSRDQNYTGDLATVFSQMARLGTNGCGFEQPLESAYRALQPNRNPGFYRESAFLAVIFVGDEDDCSASNGTLFGEPNATVADPLGPRTSFRCWEFGVQCDNDPNPRSFGRRTGCRPRNNSPYMKDIQPYVEFFQGLKPDDPKKVIVAGIIGNVDEQQSSTVEADPDNAANPALGASCTSTSGNAAPGHRLKAFLDSFPERNTTTTICNENLQDAMTQIAELLKLAVGNPCIESQLADRNPDLPGIQAECSVVDVTNPNAANREERVIPACDANGGAIPCWRFEPNAVQCPTAPDNRSIVIDRGGASVPDNTVLEVQCVTES
jgi:hypothetical protein